MNRQRKWPSWMYSPYVSYGLIVVGIALIVVFGVRSVRSYQQLQFIEAQGLDRGTASVDAIRPWMTIQYISVAYAVPEEYIFAELGVPFNGRNANDTLRGLNQTYEFGFEERDGQPLPLIIERTAEAITSYQENPVVTGLDDIRRWMTIRYISVSVGVPEAYILEQLAIPNENDNVFKPLDELAADVRYERGPRQLTMDIQQIITDYEAAE